MDEHTKHAEEFTTAPLHLSGCATDHIWLMEDGPESHPIGVRLDCGDAGTVYLSREQAKELAGELIRFATESSVHEFTNAEAPVQPSDLVYVSEIARSQEERVESFCKVLRDQSRNHKIGHGIMIFETEVDGKARLMYITNTELQELKGKSGLWRAEELVLVMAWLIKHSGVPKLDIGYEAGLEYSREMWAKHTEFSEAK